MCQYKLYDDGDGHTYLIPDGIYPMFKDRIADIESREAEDELEEYLSNFEQLEGKEFVVILDSDLEKYCNRA